MSFAPGTTHLGWKIEARAAAGPAPRFKVEKGGQAGVMRVFPFKGPQGQAHQELAERLRAWQGVEHPELVKTDVELQDRAAIVIRPKLEGLPESSFEGDKACAILQVVARALVPAHKKELAHGELSPASLCADGGRWLLLPPALQPPPAGIARLGLESDPRYAAPEVLDGRPATPASDMFSLGLILYRLLSGQAPTDTTDPADTLAARGAKPAPALENASPPMRALYEKLTALREEERPQDADELLADLEALVAKGRAPSKNPLPKGEVQAVSIGGPLVFAILLGGLLYGLIYYMGDTLHPQSPVADYVFPPPASPKASPEDTKTQ